MAPTLPGLPLEARLDIFRAVLADTTLTLQLASSNYSRDWGPTPQKQLAEQSTVAAILFVCKSFRQEALPIFFKQVKVQIIPRDPNSFMLVNRTDCTPRDFRELLEHQGVSQLARMLQHLVLPTWLEEAWLTTRHEDPSLLPNLTTVTFYCWMGGAVTDYQAGVMKLEQSKKEALHYLALARKPNLDQDEGLGSRISWDPRPLVFDEQRDYDLMEQFYYGWDGVCMATTLKGKTTSSYKFYHISKAPVEPGIVGTNAMDSWWDFSVRSCHEAVMTELETKCHDQK